MVAAPLTPVLETPASKAANGLDSLALTTPAKPFPKLDMLPEASKLAATVETVTTAAVEEEPIEEWRTRFVGDVDLDEKDEPLLKESQRRFVLFPIQYHEVSGKPVRDLFSWPAAVTPLSLTLYPDLANVQEGRSIVLDC